MTFDRSLFSKRTQVAIEAAKTSGALLQKGFQTPFSISSKPGRHNLVTEYDLASEKNIIDHIRQSFPDDNFLCEETGLTEANGTSTQWIIDPLDGTANFAHSIPVFAVSIASYDKDKPHCGVVYQPMTEELFVAESGKGAYLNGAKIKVSSIKSLDKAFLATGFPYNMQENPHQCIECFSYFIKQGIPLRRMGAAALDIAYVAAGRFEGFWETGLGPWDCAAANVILQEAKGTCSNWDGSPFLLEDKCTILATNSYIHEEMIQVLKGHL